MEVVLAQDCDVLNCPTEIQKYKNEVKTEY